MSNVFTSYFQPIISEQAEYFDGEEIKNTIANAYRAFHRGSEVKAEKLLRNLFSNHISAVFLRFSGELELSIAITEQASLHIDDFVESKISETLKLCERTPEKKAGLSGDAWAMLDILALFSDLKVDLYKHLAMELGSDFDED